MKSNKINTLITSMFVLSLFLIGILHVCGKDSTFSVKENRDLATLPLLTWKSYINGTFAQNFDSYFSDQFPLRDILLEASGYVNPLYLFRGFDKEDDVIIFERINILNKTAPASAIQPNNIHEDGFDGADVFESPAITANSAEPEVHIEAVTTHMTYVNETIAENFVWWHENAEKYADTINKLYQECGSPDTYVIIPPSPSQVYLPPKHIDADNDPNIVYKTFDAMLHGPLLVDLTDIYMEKKDEYLYFKTDHHWTALGAYYAYAKLMEHMGENADPIVTYASTVVNLRNDV